MTPNQIIGAYKAIHSLSSLVLPYKKTRELSRLKKRITEEFDVVVSMERALAEKYNGKNSSGKYTFKDPETTEAFFAEYEEALEQDTAINLPVVDLSAHTNQIKVSMSAIEALEGIVIFEKVEEDG